MDTSIDRKTLWDSAGKAGLILGGVCIAYIMLTHLISAKAETIGAFTVSLMTFVLWLAKFAGCIILMRKLMERFAKEHPGITRDESYRHGVAIALTSALVFAAFNLAYTLYIAPELIQEAFDTAMETYSKFMDSNSLEAMESMMDKMPVITFFTKLIYCFLFGTLLASIFSKSIVSDNPFDQPSNPQL